MKIIPIPSKVDFKNKFIENIPGEKFEINTALENEEYILSITPEEIKIEGGSERAVFYAKQTLKQIEAQYDKLPECKIQDKPRFPYRAFMIDSARHMQEISENQPCASERGIARCYRADYHACYGEHASGNAQNARGYIIHNI